MVVNNRVHSKVIQRQEGNKMFSALWVNNGLLDM